MRGQQLVRITSGSGLRVGVHERRGQSRQGVPELVFRLHRDLVRRHGGGVAADFDLALGARVHTRQSALQHIDTCQARSPAKCAQ